MFSITVSLMQIAMNDLIQGQGKLKRDLNLTLCNMRLKKKNG